MGRPTAGSASTGRPAASTHRSSPGTAKWTSWTRPRDSRVNARYDSLSPEQRAWVDEAAARAVQASLDANYDESAVARELCEAGVRFVDASESEVAAFRAAVAPVIDRLAADPSSGPLLAQVQELAERHPQADRPDVPASCQQPAPQDAPAGIPEVVSTLPSGAYRQEITLEDVQAAGLSNASGLTGIWTIVVTDGVFELSCRFVGDPRSDCGNAGGEGTFEYGRLHGEGDEVWFVGDAEMTSEQTGCLLPVSFTEPDHCFVLEPYRLGWSLDGDQLTFGCPAPLARRRPPAARARA
jgi:Bacterial extracellular solute-binding protein, family 7